MKILINYANDKYKQTQKVNTWTGKHIAKFDEVYSFGPEDIDLSYRNEHSDILDEPRGNGLWLWKPYFINRVLEQCQNGDFVFYVDSGAFFLKNVDVIINSFRHEENIWVSDNPTLESCFTKQVCFTALNCDNDEIKKSNQIQATYVAFIACEESRNFVKEWLSLCENKELIKPESRKEMKEPVGDAFVAHREDQSLLSLLCKIKGIKPHRDPSQRGKFPETFFNLNYTYRVPEHDDDYGSFVLLHKLPKITPIGCLKVAYNICRSSYSYRKLQNNK